MKVLGVSIEEIGGNYYYADGSDAGKLANVHKCVVCGKWAKPIFKGVPGEVESYIYETCEDCDEVMCSGCAIVTDDDHVVCPDCYSAKIFLKGAE